MSIQSEINRIKGNVASAYSAVQENGGTLPAEQNSANLAAAVRSIPRSNPNILDNWYFADPINQRGQAEYTGYGYTIDRWLITEQTGKLSVYGNCVLPSGPGLQVFCQKLPLSSIAGRTFTLSLMTADGNVASVTGTMVGSGNVSHTVPLSGNVWNLDIWELDGILIPRVYKVLEEDAELGMTAIKLELGSQQTLARQDADGNWVLNDPPPDKATELLKCQRYYQTAGIGLTPMVFSEDKILYTFPFPVQMRTTPAVRLLVSEILIHDQSTSRDLVFSGAEITIPGCTANGAGAIVVSGVWDETAPAKGALMRNNTNDAIFEFSADL